MATRIIGAVMRAVRTERPRSSVHFHRGADGRPAPCFESRCGRPHLDVD